MEGHAIEPYVDLLKFSINLELVKTALLGPGYNQPDNVPLTLVICRLVL